MIILYSLPPIAMFHGTSSTHLPTYTIIAEYGFWIVKLLNKSVFIYVCSLKRIEKDLAKSTEVIF